MSRAFSLGRMMEPLSDVSHGSTLADQKLHEEVLQLREGRRHTALQLYLEVAKASLLIVTAGIAFLLITRPDSLTTRSSAEDEMRRERARLVIDVIKERDPEVVLAGLKAIRMSYPATDAGWIHQIEREFSARSAAVTQLLKEREQLVRDRSELQQRVIQEKEGTGGTGIPGAGPVYREIESMLRHVDEQIAELDRQLLLYRGR